MNDPKHLILEGILRNDWAMAAEAISIDQNIIVATLDDFYGGQKPLHLASKMGHTDFVGNLCLMLPDNEIAARDDRGYTALHSAAVSGNVELASILLARNRDLLVAAADDGNTPICMAALDGNPQMVKFLLKNVKPGPNGDLRAEDWFRLLLIILSGNMFQIALVILDMNDSDTTASILHLSDSEVGTVLHVLAAKTGGEKCLNELMDRVWSVMRAFEPADLRRLICCRENRPPMLEAAKVGNLAFIQKLFKENHGYIWEVDEKGHTLFHVALLYRRYDILWWLDENDEKGEFPMKEKLTEMRDVEGNYLLHLAAKVAVNAKGSDTSELDNLIQLKQDFNLFEDVKKMTPNHCVRAKNKAGLEPWELFVREHAAMAKTCGKRINQMCKTFSLMSFMWTVTLFRCKVASRSIQYPHTNFLVKLTAGNTVAMLIVFCYLWSTVFSLRQLCTFVPWAFLVGQVAFCLTMSGILMVSLKIALGEMGDPPYMWSFTLLWLACMGFFMLRYMLRLFTGILGSRINVPRRRKLFV